MPAKLLLCPQCGSHRFFIRQPDGPPIYFHVDEGHNPVPTRESNAELQGLDFSLIWCCGCSWKGSPRKLVRYFL